MGTKGPLSCDNFYHASETDAELQRIRRRCTLTNEGSAQNPSGWGLSTSAGFLR